MINKETFKLSKPNNISIYCFTGEETFETVFSRIVICGNRSFCDYKLLNEMLNKLINFYLQESNYNNKETLSNLYDNVSLKEYLLNDNVDYYVKRLYAYAYARTLSFQEKECIFINGGAQGADYLSSIFCAENGLYESVFSPDYSKYPGRYAPIHRNKEMLDVATTVVAFLSTSYPSKGTRYMINASSEKKIPLIVIET